MGDKTGISWTDATWNPMRGCSRTAPAGSSQSGCGDPTGGGCYAERNGYRFAGPGLAYEGLVRMTPNGARWTGKVLLVDEHLLDPLRWNKPRRIFTTSVSDPFHERFSDSTIAVVVGVMALSYWHDHQLLTKRASRGRRWFAMVEEESSRRGMTPANFCISQLVEYLKADPRCVFSDRDRNLVADEIAAGRDVAWPLPNLWLGVSVENQAAADERIPELLDTPAAVRFLSCEPLLGPVDIAEYFDPCSVPCGEDPWEALHWVIAGCESGPGARPCDVAWLRSLRDQCADASVAFFLKQAVELRGSDDESGDCHRIAMHRGSKRKPGGLIDLPALDGEQHAAFPEVSR